jgi:multidrug efflux pump subunit AcrA (membrane-fusion protein)
MNQSTRNIVIVAAVLVLLVAGVWWSQSGKAAPAGHLIVAGDVRPEIRTITAPAISYPTPDYTVGIPKPAGSTGSSTGSQQKSSSSSARSASAGMPVVAGMLTSVPVREGDHVKAGDVVATFDKTLLNLGVSQAKHAEIKAHKDVAVLDKNIDKLITASNKLITARGKLATAASKLKTAKAGLLKARSALLKARTQVLSQRRKLLQAKAQRPQMEAALAALKAQAATFPPGKVPAAIQKQIAQISGLLAAIDPGLAAISAGLQKISANLAKVNAGLAAVKKGQAQLARARVQIANGASQLATAKTQLRDAKDVLKIVAKGQSIGVLLAETKRDFATVLSPVDGVVTFARRSGTVAMVGAPIVRIHVDGPQRVDTYLTADQVAQVGLGSKAEITYDSAPGTIAHGVISELGSSYVFPPTSFPTQVVHMTRALKATITLDEGSTAPPGTPVDVTIHTNANK